MPLSARHILVTGLRRRGPEAIAAGPPPCSNLLHPRERIVNDTPELRIELDPIWVTLRRSPRPPIIVSFEPHESFASRLIGQDSEALGLFYRRVRVAVTPAKDNDGNDAAAVRFLFPEVGDRGFTVTRHNDNLLGLTYLEWLAHRGNHPWIELPEPQVVAD